MEAAFPRPNRTLGVTPTGAFLMTTSLMRYVTNSHTGEMVLSPTGQADM